MTLAQIATYVCQKMARTDASTLALAAQFVKARHRMIYESFNWDSAQVMIDLTLTAPQSQPVDVAGVDNIVSVRYNGQFLDPVGVEFIFDTHPEMVEATGDPQFYNETYNQITGKRAIQFYPQPDAAAIGAGVLVNVLGKASYNDLSVNSQVPFAQQALVAFVQADVLEYLHQAGKAQEKLKEAQALLATAQAADRPPAQRTRMGKVLTATGNSLSELTDSVCDVIGQWAPEIRISVQERIRRNYQTLWEMCLWPESTVVARVTATDNEQIILPHYIDRVVSVRQDKGSTGQPVDTELFNRDISLFFNIDPLIFERLADPIYYTTLPPVAVAVLPPYREPLLFSLSAPANRRLSRHPTGESIDVFVKGWSNGAEVSETVTVSTGFIPGPQPPPPTVAGTATSQLSYDTPTTIAKPPSQGTLTVTGANSGRVLLTLNPDDRDRKFLRIWLLPNQSTAVSSTGSVTTPSTFLVLGKKHISALIDDADTCELRNVENILINGAGADMLDKLAPADATTFSLQKQRADSLRTKAGASIQLLQDAELKQATHNSIVTPYTEPTMWEGSSTSDSFWIGK